MAETNEAGSAGLVTAEPTLARADIGTPARTAMVILTVAGIGLSVYQLFGLGKYVTTLLQGQYLYLLAGLFLAQVFLCFRMFRTSPSTPQWYDWALSGTALAGMGYFAATAEQSLDSGWEYAAPESARWVSLLVYALILEGTRRAGGFTLFIIVAIFSVYPTFADKVPNPLNGFAQPFWDTVPYHIISAESSFGIPMRAFVTLVIGFILFGAVLQRTGGGKFFNDLALALVGRFRGGAAKVAIFASGFMGSMSGSVISNVLTTGAVSIPAMKKSGFQPRYAAATEACASTGGVRTGGCGHARGPVCRRPFVCSAGQRHHRRHAPAAEHSRDRAGPAADHLCLDPAPRDMNTRLRGRDARRCKT